MANLNTEHNSGLRLIKINDKCEVVIKIKDSFMTAFTNYE